MKRPDAKAQAFCREVPIYDVFFLKFTVNVSRFVKMMCDPRALVFLALGSLLLFAADPNDVRISLGAVTALLIWFGATAVYIGTLTIMIGLFSAAQRYFGAFPVYTPVTATIGLLVVFLAVRTTVEGLTGAALSAHAAPLFFNLMISGLVLETLFIRFVMPMIVGDKPVAASAPAMIHIGDRHLPISRIRHMTAQEHYVAVTGPADTLLIRARLGDAVAQTGPDQGIQPHRSWWVSVAAQPRIAQHNNKPVLILSDNTVVPIARARLSAVQAWVDTHGNW